MARPRLLPHLLVGAADMKLIASNAFGELWLTPRGSIVIIARSS